MSFGISGPYAEIPWQFMESELENFTWGISESGDFQETLCATITENWNLGTANDHGTAHPSSTQIEDRDTGDGKDDIGNLSKAAEKTIRQIHKHMEQHNTRYGYIVNNEELILLQRQGTGSGHLDVSQVRRKDIDDDDHARISTTSDDMQNILSHGMKTVSVMFDFDITDGRSKQEEQEILLESEYPTNTTTLESEDKYTRTTLSVGLPRNLMHSGLWLSFLNSVDRIYTELDKLPNSGFALGLDILPEDIPIVDVDDISIFSGKIQIRIITEIL